MHTGHCLNECGAMGHNLYVYCLGFRTTAALFDPRTSICWLRAIDPFEGPLKLLLSKKLVYSCFVDSNCLILLTQKLFALTSPLYDWKKNQTIWTIPFLLISILLSTIADVKNTWLIEPIKIRPSVNSLILRKRLMNCWSYDIWSAHFKG